MIMEPNTETIEPLELFVDHRTVLTVGVFDGVHLGHQYLVGQTVSRAKELGCLAAILTFDPHPELVLRPASGSIYLTTLDERMQLLRTQGVDLRLLLHFDKNVASLPAADFLDLIQKRINLCELWIGPDFALGRQREGGIDVLEDLGRKHGFRVCAVPEYLIDNEVVSSTRIRRCLSAGDVQIANRLLGRPASLTGKVVEGFRRGRQIGYPTANLAADPNVVLPADGVYAVCAYVDGKAYKAVTSIGVRPSFDNGHRTVETYLLGFKGDIYGHDIKLEFRERLRGEVKFASVKDLVSQIERDVERAREVLAPVACK
jgi:riboflavin kinase/FMN adenylyltransferase